MIYHHHPPIGRESYSGLRFSFFLNLILPHIICDLNNALDVITETVPTLFLIKLFTEKNEDNGPIPMGFIVLSFRHQPEIDSPMRQGYGLCKNLSQLWNNLGRLH